MKGISLVSQNIILMYLSNGITMLTKPIGTFGKIKYKRYALEEVFVVLFSHACVNYVLLLQPRCLINSEQLLSSSFLAKLLPLTLTSD